MDGWRGEERVGMVRVGMDGYPTVRMDGRVGMDGRIADLEDGWTDRWKDRRG